MAAFAMICSMASCKGNIDDKMDAIFQPVFPEGEPGGAVLLMRQGKILYDKGFGVADLKTGAAIDGNTSFNIASCSKQFTAVAVLQLVSQGNLSLEDKIIDYFPEFLQGKPCDSLWKDIRVKHLLSHSSGIPDGRGYLSCEAKIAGDETLAMEYLYSLDHLNFPPGTQYEYINPTFVLLGRLVEKVSGEEFTFYVKNHIFGPAGMSQTVYFDRDHQEAISNMAHGYEYDDVSSMGEERVPSEDGLTEKKDWYEYDFGEETFFATRPDGGIYSSTREIAKWEKVLQKAEIIDTQLLEDAWTARVKVSGSPWSDYQNRPGTWYGYGWFIEKDSADDAPRCIYHTGDNGGFKALVARYPASETLLVILANRADWDRAGVKSQVENLLGI